MEIVKQDNGKYNISISETELRDLDRVLEAYSSEYRLPDSLTDFFVESYEAQNSCIFKSY